MKKALYALLIVTILGGAAFGLSQSNLLKGTFPELAQTEGSDGGSNGDDDDELVLEGNDGTFRPGGGTITPPKGGGGGTNDCEAEYYLDLYVDAITGESISGISESKFTVQTTSGSDVSSQFDFDDSDDSSGNYRFDFTGSSALDDYEIVVNPNGYKEGSAAVSTNSTCSDIRTASIVELEFNHTIAVNDHDGNNVSDATVVTGTSYQTECEYWSSESVYICATPDSETEQYRVSLTGYVAETGNFTDLSSSQGSWINDFNVSQSYDYSDVVERWENLNTSWSAEDLMGIYTDPTWGMEEIPDSWDFEQYIDPEYWMNAEVYQEEFYGTGNTEEYYTEILDFYAGILSGSDLTRFENDQGYHDFMVNSYINTAISTAAYQAAMVESYTQGYMDYSSYSTNMTSYRTQTNIRLFKTPFNFSKLGLASLIAATNSSSAQQGNESVAQDTSASSSNEVAHTTEYNNYEGELTIDKTVNLNEFAWTLTLNDSSTGEAITDADVTIDTGSESDCDHEEDGLYWCSETSYYSSSGNKPSYSITATDYESVSGNFSIARTSLTDDGVNESIELTSTDTTDLASYCESVTISSDDLPLAYDATELGDITIDVEVSASSSDFESTLYTKIYSGDGTLTDGTDTVYGSTGGYIYGDISGTTYTKSYTYSDGLVGDSIHATAADGCNDTFVITQEEAPDEDAEYALACTDVDITPDSYEIYLSANSSTLHEFEIEWTVVEQMVSLREAPEWIKRSFAYKHSNNPFVNLAEETGFDPITLTIATTGNGDLYFDDLATAYTELEIEIDAEETDNLTFYYSGADGGDSLYVTSSDSSCSDSLTLLEEEDESEDDEDEDEEDDDIDFDEIIDGCEASSFTDVDEDDDMAPYINCLAATGAVQGYGDGTYGPGNDITNAELIKILVAMTGEPLESSSADTDFLDIDGHWAERYIKTAEALNIARPIENLYFYPDAPATRTFLALGLVRAAEKTLWGWDADDIPFSDVLSTDPEAYAVILLNEAEGDVPGVGEEVVLQGYSDGSFRGYNSIRRDEAAALLIRAFYAWFL